MAIKLEGEDRVRPGALGGYPTYVHDETRLFELIDTRLGPTTGDKFDRFVLLRDCKTEETQKWTAEKAEAELDLVWA